MTRETLRADAIAGLTAAVIVLPQGVAFATLAGMPPQYGLYAAMVPVVIAALFGSSWHLVAGPTNVMSIFLFASLSPLALPGSPDYIKLALTLTFLMGIFKLTLGIARMGAVVNFISHTVVISFTAGAACLIFSAQLTNFFGLYIPRGLSFYDTLAHFVLGIANVNLFVTATGLVTLLAGMFCRRRYPKFPYMIAAMFVGSMFAVILNLIFGAEHTAIATIGALPGSLPELSSPDLSADAIKKTLPAAFAITILSLTEAVTIARAIALKSGQRIDGNQEFIGQGLSNIASAYFSGYASSGSFNRSTANYEAGARTPLAAVFSVPLLILILLVVAPLAQYLPLAVMGALLFMIAWSLFDRPHMRNILRTSRKETVVMLVTFFAALFADLAFAIYAGVLLSLMLYLLHVAHPLMLDVKPDPSPDAYHFSADSGLPDCPQIKMLRVNGSIFFGAVDHVQQGLEDIGTEYPAQQHVVLVASGINFIDIAGAEMLANEARKRRRAGGGLYFYRMKDEVRGFLAKGGYLAEIGEHNVFPVKVRVIEKIYPKLDREICRTCKVRIFRECKHVLPDGTPREPETPS